MFHKLLLFGTPSTHGSIGDYWHIKCRVVHQVLVYVAVPFKNVRVTWSTGACRVKCFCFLQSTTIPVFKKFHFRSMRPSKGLVLHKYIHSWKTQRSLYTQVRPLTFVPQDDKPHVFASPCCTSCILHGSSAFCGWCSGCRGRERTYAQLFAPYLLQQSHLGS